MDVKFEWKDIHQDAFMKLKEAIIQAPILRYLDTTKPYIVYTDASDDACGAQLSQIHDGTEFPVAFLSHFYGHAEEMEYTRARSLRYLLCHQEMALLPPRSGYHSKK